MFLQGNATPFFPMLGAELSRRGHDVIHVAFNAGDHLFWHAGRPRIFRGRMAAWTDYFAALLQTECPDAIVLFGQWRDVHRHAIACGTAKGIPVWIFDEGYIRPGWIRMERAMPENGSSLPNRAPDILDAAHTLPDLTQPGPFRSSFLRRAAFDVLYHVVRLAGWAAYPYHRFHAPISPFMEYGGYLRKFLFTALTRRQRKAKDAPTRDHRPYILFPMQLDGDFQVRLCSRFQGNFPAIAETLTSFSAHAPADLHLIFKLHPLDNGLFNWRKAIMTQAAALGVSDRVHYVESEMLDELVMNASGIVTINSTVGLFALERGRPVKTLGSAIYDIAGLSCQNDLDHFWQERHGPNPLLLSAFRKLVLNRASAPGDYFSTEGLQQAVRAAATRIEIPD
ncbi:capsular biosynthesis protein [Gluconacetobacter tumulisoli]|uniref:Capsular biosynthesis protein n=1 Tax=Gluconacetobacter tumulisoli TaxID=1286189 RepID=A0A7W4K662_9PROT|nr:capsular biosynthesis protein [Gluconacetobacter tumulisoli]MBB2201125.1 capsular biosynthesis protein [Gluconacetobacter tumulisoli]